MNTDKQLISFYKHLESINQLNSISALLGWDQRTYMPVKGAEGRAKQLQALSQIIHQRKTDSDFVKLVDQLDKNSDQLSENDLVNVKETKRKINKSTKLPESFILEQSKTHSESFSTWIKARPANDFKAMLPLLEKNIDLARREAEYIGYAESPYDALLDGYDPGATIKEVKPLLTQLAQELSTLIPAITEKCKTITTTKGYFPKKKQKELSSRVAQEIGYSFEYGSLDETHHPFMMKISSGDIRITTRYDESNLFDSLTSVLHEAGHGLYEAGLLAEHEGTPMGSSVSLSIHESQSRLYENLIGRSRPFARYLQPIIQEIFPKEAKQMDPNYIWQQLNNVAPSTIRINADEVTYSLHIVIRMLLEEALINKELEAADLPNAWSELYKKYLSVDIPNDKDGVMQDVHWYVGSFGYFPTYALGNLYGAFMMEQIRVQIPNLDTLVEAGDFKELLDWLKSNVHQHGMKYTGKQIAQRLSGGELTHKPFINYIKSKFNLTN